MRKFLFDLSFIIAFFCLSEEALYYKDYCELKLFSKYVEYDIKKYNINSFSNDLYEVVIKENKEYEIVMNRNNILNINRYKKIKYNGIVS